MNKNPSFSPFTGRRWPEGPDEGASPPATRLGKVAKARELRKVENEAEAVLWSELRGRRLNGYKIVRQFPIGPYFADFACRKANLVIEVDGSQHADNHRDQSRDRGMNQNGWSVLRVWHADVLKDRKVILDTILAALDGNLSRVMTSHEVRYMPAVQMPDSLS